MTEDIYFAGQIYDEKRLKYGGLARAMVIVRRVLIALVIVLMLLSLGLWLERRANSFRQLAEHHDEQFTMWGYNTEGLPKSKAEAARRWAEYHGKLGRKYHRAAHYPYLFVEPDPPALE